MPRVGRAQAAAAFVTAVLAGCGEEPGPPEGPAEAAIRVVERLDAAIGAGDFDRVCDDLYGPAIRRQAGGGDCPAMLRRTAGNLAAPRITVRHVAVGGGEARVEVLTTAEGQAPVPETILLERGADGSFEIAGLD